jgi:hypothetical protein
MTYEELIDTTPKELFRRQIVENRKYERRWEIGRELIAACINPHTKHKVKGSDIIELSIDRKKVRYEWDDELVRKVLKAWN